MKIQYYNVNKIVDNNFKNRVGVPGQMAPRPFLIGPGSVTKMLVLRMYYMDDPLLNNLVSE